MFRAVNRMMAALFALAVAVQFNDPDPAGWMAIYGAAMVVTIAIGRRGAVPVVAPLLVGGVALIWGLMWSVAVPTTATYAHLFDRWEMKNAAVEEARETGGLLIVAAWMAVLAVHRWRRARTSRSTPQAKAGVAGAVPSPRR